MSQLSRSKKAHKIETAATLIDVARDMLPEGHPYAEPDLYVIRLTLAKLQGQLAAKATKLIIDSETDDDMRSLVDFDSAQDYE